MRASFAFPAVACLVLSSVAPGQGPGLAWQQAYGGYWDEIAYSMVPTSDGGFMVAGFNKSFGPSTDVYLVKTDGNGALEWEETYGGSSEEYGRSVIQTADEGYAVAGYTYSYGAGGKDVYLFRTDADGVMLWDETYGGTSNDDGCCVVETSDGGFAIAGSTQSFGSSWSAYLIKTSASGVLQWQKYYGGSEIDAAASVVQTSDGGYALLGRTYSYGAGSEDFYLIRADSTGNMLWYKTFGGSGIEEGNSIRQTFDGGFILAGYTSSFGAGGYDMYLVKTDEMGSLSWSTTFGTPGTDMCNDVLQTWDGGYVLAGYHIWDGTDVVLVRTDDAGDTVWLSTYGGGGNENGFALAQMPDGGYAVAGLTDSYGAGDYDFWLMRTEPPLGIEEDPAPAEGCLSVGAASPNPSASAVTLCFSTSAALPVSLSVYDLSGRLVGVMDEGVLPPGSHLVAWNAPERLPSGCYTLILSAGAEHASRRCVLIGQK